MNKLILIGNGFDLAHGLKTSYNDFITWYLNKCCNRFRSDFSFTDNLMKINWTDNTTSVTMKEFSSITEFLNVTRGNKIKVDYINTFFGDIIIDANEYNWVDIESKYYKALVLLYSQIVQPENDNLKKILIQVKGLNACFNFIKAELSEYLLTIDNKVDKINEDINYHLFEDIVNANKGIPVLGKEDLNKILVLNFNYTSTFEKYMINEGEIPFKISYIHGKLQDVNNPIIFGYGDEMHKYYEQIEQLDEDEFLMHIKSFGYFKNKNYQDLSDFIESGDFNVYIMGHSCGLSDRVLLNSIFENDKCKNVKIFYHQKNITDNDYFEKTQRISRHFKASSKGKMRTRIIPYSESAPLTKFKA